ncbi:filamentous hemagglutinin N-terminal domain-containing protein [Candidatus Neptunochlamydia vexilliferae]|nr:filamentous hemagglutinin N-terminal domain-containing protein [Candidatus Neptunochlamydia vexilliferae]
MDKTYVAALILAPIFLMAKPSGPKVAQGEATFAHPTNQHMEIVTGNKTIINWESFSIAEGETIQFKQLSNLSAVLNRVSSKETSALLGALKSNGTVYLINPNGILIGPNATIDTHAFIASSLDVLDSEFLEGKTLRFFGDSDARVVNLGKVSASSGDVILLGRFVKNEGQIAAPNGMVGVAVGREILLKPGSEERIFISPSSESDRRKGIGISGHGDIEALKIRLIADGNPYKLAINHNGKADALNVENRGGDIYLVAEGGSVEVSGTLTATQGTVHVFGKEVLLDENALVDVSSNFGGGQVLIGGSKQGKNRDLLHSESTIVREGATIRANTFQKGKGGEVVLWSDGSTFFAGKIEVRGGKTGGDGGFVEVSGAHLEKEAGHVDRTASIGLPGTLLYDPSDILITSNSSSSGMIRAGGKHVPTAQTTIFSVQSLINDLRDGPVEIATHSAFGGNGDIIIESDMYGYDSDYPLTLLAERNLIVQGDVQNEGWGDIICNVGKDLQISGQDRVSRLGSRYGNVSIKTGRHLLVLGGKGGQGQIGSDAAFLKSNIDLTVGGDLIVQAVDHFALIGHINTSHTTADCDRSLSGNITIHHVGGDVRMTSSSKDFCFAQIGLAAEKDNAQNSAIVHAQGDITLSNVNGTVELLAAHGGKDAYTLIGHGGTARRFKDTYSGNITVDAKGSITLVGDGNCNGKFVGIGFGQDFTVTTETHTFTSDLVSVTSGGDITLTAGQGNSATFIGAFTGNSEKGETDAKIGTVRVVAEKNITLNNCKEGGRESAAGLGIVGTVGPAFCNLSLFAGKDLKIHGEAPKTGSSYAFISNGVGVGPWQGRIDITVSQGDLSLIGNSLTREQASIDSAGILNINILRGSLRQNNASMIAQGPLSLFAGKDLILAGGEQTLYTSGPTLIQTHGDFELIGNSHIDSREKEITFLIGGSVRMGTGSTIKNHSNAPLTLSVNHGAKYEFGVLPKGIHMAPGSKINSAGNILLYTPSRDVTRIEGTINNVAFTPGPLFVNSETEAWAPFSFDPSTTAGIPLCIFYRNGAASFANIEQSQLLVSELLTDLHPMNEYLGWSEEFQLAYDEDAYEKRKEKGLSSFQVIGDQLYFQRMMNHSFHNVRMNGFITFPKPIENTEL